MDALTETEYVIDRERQALIRSLREEAERDANTCSWCSVPLPVERHGTGACDERCSVLFQAKQDGRHTCCVVCETDFTPSQVSRNASTCSPRCRKLKHRWGL